MRSENVLSRAEMIAMYADFYNSNSEINVPRDLVPKNLRSLVPYAEFWGLTDDWARQDLVLQATNEVRQNLKGVVALHDDEMDAWLAGPEAFSKAPSDAYLAFSAMRMAADFV